MFLIFNLENIWFEGREGVGGTETNDGMTGESIDHESNSEFPMNFKNIDSVMQPNPNRQLILSKDRSTLIYDFILNLMLLRTWFDFWIGIIY